MDQDLSSKPKSVSTTRNLTENLQTKGLPKIHITPVV